MDSLTGFQKRYLRGLAHGIKPVIFVGHKGIAPPVADAISDALDHHELVKVKFVEFKQKEKKRALVQQIEQAVTCQLVGMIGHVATFYRQQIDPQKRKIHLPLRGDG